MPQGTLTRGRLAEHPLWSRVLGAPELARRLLLPVVVSGAVEDRERVEGLPGFERLSLTELVREARSASGAGIAGLLIFGVSDRKDERATLATERDHVVLRAVHAVKDALPDLAVATDVCVCAYTSHGQCVLFGADGADVAGTLERLAEIAVAHASAGADLLLPSGMLDGSVAAVRRAVSDAGHDAVPVAAMLKLESAMYASHRSAVNAVPIRERAVPLIAADDATAARARALRDLAAGGDALVVKPGLATGDLVRSLTDADRPVVSYHTLDEHLLFVTAADGAMDATRGERETVAAARRAGASLVVTNAALEIAEAEEAAPVA